MRVKNKRPHPIGLPGLHKVGEPGKEIAPGASLDLDDKVLEVPAVKAFIEAGWLEPEAPTDVAPPPSEPVAAAAPDPEVDTKPETPKRKGGGR